MPVLLLVTGPSAGKRYELQSEVTLGRSPSCEVPLEDQRVSRRHARLEWADGHARVQDLGSRNGTLVNGERIDVPVVLLPGDRVQVGDTTVLYEPSARAAVTETGGGGALAVPLEDLLSVVGSGDASLRAALAVAGAGSEIHALRRAAEWLRTVAGGQVAVLAGEGSDLATLVVAGGNTEGVEIPRALLRAALERREVVRAAGELVAPLAAGEGAPWGVLYLRRGDPHEDREARLAAVAARLAGEQCAGLRAGSSTERLAVPVGTSRPFRACLEKVRRAAHGAEPVVLHGETGSGRRLLARFLHAQGRQSRGPCVVVDCAAPSVDVERELFGAPSGGGQPARRSAPVRADGGTLVLAGLDSLPRSLGERFLRQWQRLCAVVREERVELRLVATARAPLSLLVEEGGLDPELAGVLAGTVIAVPPLRERGSDVAALLGFFCDGRAPNLSPDAERMLGQYPWPGNVRELELLAARLGLLYAGRDVTALLLPPEFQGAPLQAGGRAAEGGGRQTLAERVSRLERDAISEALREAGGKKILAAQLLGISRPTLDKKIADYGLVVEKARAR